jgi:Tat protein translocase TatB subunit
MLSIPHLVIIFLIALIVLGPEKLPQLARTMGKAMADFRRITTDFRYQIEDEMREMERHTRMQQVTAEPSPFRPGDPELLGAVPAEAPSVIIPTTENVPGTTTENLPVTDNAAASDSSSAAVPAAAGVAATGTLPEKPADGESKPA